MVRDGSFFVQVVVLQVFSYCRDGKEGGGGKEELGVLVLLFIGGVVLECY